MESWEDYSPSRLERARDWAMGTMAKTSGNPLEWAVMILYWFVVIQCGDHTGFTIAALGITMIVLALSSKGFMESVTNNDWVMKTARVKLLVAVFCWWADPSAPPGPPFSLNPLAWIGWLLKSSFHRAPMTSPFEEGGFWETINPILIGSSNWKSVFFSCFWFALLATPVSRWDDWKRAATDVKWGKSESPLAKKFLTHIKMEFLEIPLHILWWVLKIPFRILIGR